MCFFLGYKNRDTLKTYKSKTYYSINEEDEPHEKDDQIQMNVVPPSFGDSSNEDERQSDDSSNEGGRKQEQYVDNLI